MFYHLILGLLRDGRPRHGYELICEYRERSGSSINPGNFYRECSKLSANGMILPARSKDDADPRRIPYHITAAGCRAFDVWLLEPETQDGLGGWLMFVEMVPRHECERLLDRIQEELWLESKALVTAREAALSRERRPGKGCYKPAVLMLLRRIKQVTAELEFLEDVRLELKQLPTAVVPRPSPPVTARDVPRVQVAGAARASRSPVQR